MRRLPSPHLEPEIQHVANTFLGEIVQIAPGWYKNTATGAYNVNQAELGRFCHAHPDNCRIEARYTVTNKEAR